MTARRLVALLLLGLCLNGMGPNAPARAAPEGATWTATLSGAGSSLWNSATAMVGHLFSWVWPSAPDLQASMGEHEGRFRTLIGTIGYGVKGFQTSIGLIPSASSTFQLAREMSDADYEEFERQMASFEREDGGPLARFQRMILLALLDAQSVAAYKVDRVELSVLPLPQATFHLSPGRTVMSEEHDVLLRAIEHLQGHFP